MVRHGLRWYTGYGLGLADCDGVYPMRSHGNGYVQYDQSACDLD